MVWYGRRRAKSYACFYGACKASHERASAPVDEMENRWGMANLYTQDADLYLRATEEFESGNRAPAVWAKALALNAGDLDKAKYEYIRVRVEGLRESLPANKEESIAPAMPTPNETEITLGNSKNGRALSNGPDDEIIEAIRAGDLRGRIIDGTWYLQEDGLAANSAPPITHSENHSTATNSFRALLNGDLGLARTYWLYGILVGTLFGLAIRIFIAAGELAASGIVTFISLSYSAVVLIGIWRASEKYSGPKVWSTLAKVATVLGWLQIVIAIFAILAALVA